MKQVLLKQARRSKAASAASEFGVGDLMLAVLGDALETYKEGLASSVPAKRVEAFRVEAWVASDDVDWPFSFLNVCQAVGVSPDYVRTCLVRWRRKALGADEWEN